MFMRSIREKTQDQDWLKLTALFNLLDSDNTDFSAGKKEDKRGRPPLDLKSMLGEFMGMIGTTPLQSDSPSRWARNVLSREL